MSPAWRHEDGADFLDLFRDNDDDTHVFLVVVGDEWSFRVEGYERVTLAVGDGGKSAAEEAARKMLGTMLAVVGGAR